MTDNLEFILKLKDLLTPAMQSAGNISEAEATKIANQIHKVEVASDGANAGVGRLKSGLGLLAEVAVPLVSAFAGFEFIKESEHAFDDQAQAVAQLNASLSSTKGAAGLSSEALIQQAEALQKTTLYGDEATEKMQSLLLTFTNIKGTIFTQAVPAIQDMATKMGYDMKDAALQVGKALNDPIKGITALRRVGVAFSDDQQKLIKHLVETNQTAAAQSLILKELKTEFGGSAEAAAKAGEGPFKQLANRFNDVQERIGEIALKLGTALMPLLNGFVTLVDKSVTGMKNLYHWFQDNKTAIEVLSGAILSGVLAYQVYQIWSERTVIWSGIKTAAAVIEMGAMTALGTAVEFVNAAFIASPVGWIIAGVMALVGVIIYLVKNFEGWGKTWNNLMEFCKYSWAAFKDTFLIIWLGIEDSFMSGMELIEKGWYHLKGLWDDEGAAAGLDKINKQQNSRAEDIAAAKGLLASDVKAAEDSLKWEVHRKASGAKALSPTSAFEGHAGAAGAGPLAGDIGDGKSKADSINSGGQRSIVINIAKQIEKLEVHVMDAKEGANEIESMVRDAMRRVIYSVNGMAS